MATAITIALEPNVCPLCLDDIDRQRKHTTICRHDYHKRCFHRYIDYQRRHRPGSDVRCPICQSIVNVTEEHQGQPGSRCVCYVLLGVLVIIVGVVGGAAVLVVSRRS